MALGAGQSLKMALAAWIYVASVCEMHYSVWRGFSLDDSDTQISAHPWSVGYAFTVKHTELILSFQSIETSTSK